MPRFGWALFDYAAVFRMVIRWRNRLIRTAGFNRGMRNASPWIILDPATIIANIKIISIKLLE